MLTCSEIPALASDLIDGQLPLVQRARVQLHLALCPNCRTYVRGLSASIRLTAESLQRDHDTAAADRVIAALVKAGVAGPEG